MKTLEEVKASITATNGTVGASVLASFAGSYRDSVGFNYVEGGDAYVPKNWKDNLFIDPVKNPDGTDRLDSRGNPIFVKGILVNQNGGVAKLAIGVFQKSIAEYTKDGDVKLDSKGNRMRAEASGDVVDLYRKTCAANTEAAYTKFFDAIADKDISIKLEYVWGRQFGSATGISQQPVHIINFK